MCVEQEVAPLGTFLPPSEISLVIPGVALE